MKKKIQFFLLILAGSLIFAACSKDNEQPGGEPTSEPAADYTIMLYGCGGANLDPALLYNLGQVAGYGYSSQVQFAAKVKFSIPYQTANPDIYGGTRLYTLTKQGMTNEQVGTQDYRLDDPQNLADFITDTKKRLPAKQYILILWNHGSEFTIRDQLVASSYPEKVVTRDLINDDNTGESLSIFEQEEAYKRANIKLDLLYWDVCLMHTIENLCQIKDYTRYVLGAGHLTSGLGGNYALLMNILERNSNLLTAMQEYIPATVNHWDNVEGKNGAKDLTLSDTQYVDEVAQNMKTCIGSLIAYRDALTPGTQEELEYHFFNGTAQSDEKAAGQEEVKTIKPPYYSAGGLLYYYALGNNSADMLSAFIRMGNSSMNGQLSAQTTKLKLAVDKMIPISHCSDTPFFINRISLGINWIDKEHFRAYFPRYEQHSLKELYPHLRFEQIAGWSRFLDTNIRKNVAIRTVTDPETGQERVEFYEVTEPEQPQAPAE